MGLREKTETSCEHKPIAGKIAMYTSGWPKNQKRCCHKSGDPPACGCRRSLITNPAGMKKLVPATRSRISRMQAGIKTADAMSPMTDVMNHAHVEYGIRATDIP